jgi:phage gpG-like protein
MTLKVDGLRQLTRDLEAAGVQVADLRAAFGGIAKEAATLAAGFAPRRSGRLAASIRASSAKNYATVSAGNSRVPYAGAINYGWRRRNITGASFMQRADVAIRPHVLSDLVTAVDKLLRDKDLS